MTHTEDGYIADICGADDPDEVMQPYLCRRPVSWVGTRTADSLRDDLAGLLRICDHHHTLWMETSPGDMSHYEWEAFSQPPVNPQPRIIVIQHDDRGNEIAHTIPLDAHTTVLIETWDEAITVPGTHAQAYADASADIEGVTSARIYIQEYGIHHVFGGKGTS